MKNIYFRFLNKSSNVQPHIDVLPVAKGFEPFHLVSLKLKKLKLIKENENMSNYK